MIGSLSNRWSAAAAAACIALSATNAQGAFTGFSVVTTVEGNYRRHVLYANFNGANDTVFQAFHFNKTVGGGSPVFIHNDAISGGTGNSTVAGTWNPQFLLVPGALDSYVTIGGGEGFASGNSTLADPNWNTAGFNQAQVPFLAAGTTIDGPGWYVSGGANYQGLQSNGKVKLGQFIMSAGADPATLFLKIVYNTGAGTAVQFAQGTFTLPCASDCDANGLCDPTEISQNPALDCDQDGILNLCEIASGAALDCDADGIPDNCEIASGTGADCDGDGVLNSCEIASGAAFDCDADGVPDNCEIASGSGFDCNNNGTLDSCEIAAGLADCDSDGRPDVCEGAVAIDTQQSFAISSAAPVDISFTSLPRAYRGTPRLEIRATADLGSSTDALVVSLDGGVGTVLFLTDGTDCPATPNLGTITRDIPSFNALVADGTLQVRVTTIGQVNTAACPNGGVSVRLVYDGIPSTSDCNGNLVLDSCELGTGAQFDCNANGVLDVCDIAGGSASDCNANGRPDTCDIASGSSSDLDGNGVPDDCSGQYIVGGSGFATISAAIAAAPDGAVIRVGAGTYGPFTLTGRSLELKSLAGAATTILDGAGARVVDIAGQGAGPLVIDGFTIRGGVGSGAGMRVTDAGPSVRNCVFTQNSAPSNRGGGAQCIRSTARFTNCTFTANTALQGGGLSVEGLLADGHLVQVVGCTFTSNVAATYGGAINCQGPMTLTDSLVEANAANAAPPLPILSGGLHIFSLDPVTIADTKFCRNTVVNIVGSYIDAGGVIKSQDCDADGVCDYDEIASGAEVDCNGNTQPDDCDIAQGAADCNENGVPDSCDIASGASDDIDANTVPDECQPDCDDDGQPDSFEIAQGAADCNGDGVPDSCNIAAGTSSDLDANGVPDECSGQYVVGGTGYASIAAAITAAPDGATIRVAPGVYGPISLTARALTLVSLGGAAQTFIDGGGTQRGLSMQSAGQGPTILEGFTFRNCFAVTGGGARITLSAPEFRQCVFTANSASERGGAVALLSAPARFVGCEFIGNDCAGNGGALYLSGEPTEGQAAFVGCVFTGNESGTIGGAVLNSGRLLLDGCVIEANTALIAGAGASFLSTGTAEVADTKFCRNVLGNVQGSFVDLGGNSFSQDCDADGLCDLDEIVNGDELDCDGNGFPDGCDLASGVPDCNENGVPDSCDIAAGASNDVDENGVPDECKPDCDGDGLPDAYELANGLDLDCDANGVIDSCDIAAGADDDDNDGRLDRCEFAQGDLDLNGLVNGADLAALLSLWGIPNPPLGDLNGDGLVNAADLAGLLSNWGPVD